MTIKHISYFIYLFEVALSTDEVMMETLERSLAGLARFFF